MVAVRSGQSQNAYRNKKIAKTPPLPKNELIIELFELNHKFIRNAAAAAYSTSTKTLFTILYFSMRRTIAAKA